ncbi:MAG TPA: hypothetical protein VK517_16985 [Cyclobacteriaceae bacterium]|nr:hypothetical protein [Cyclobacteriaceae bacterium]
MMKFWIWVALLILQSCASYYQSSLTFNQDFESGDLPKALANLRAHASDGSGKRAFLYDVNNGLVLSLLGRYEESNDYFEKAYLFGEDYRKNYLNEVESYLTNPNVTAYRGEDHEHLMLLYYKALNYLKLNKTEDALVECRRLDTRLQQLSDRYDSDNKYRHDAFINTLMGIIYDMDKDYNNAFIAYRNAYGIYSQDYQSLFGLGPPDQLKEDLLRTAFLSGMTSEWEDYKKEFGREDYQYHAPEGGELIFFWHNGLSPVKAEWGINFIVSRQGDWVTFSNPDMGISFPFNVAGYSEQDRKSLGRMDIFRVAFPKYVERPTYYSSASLETPDQSLNLQLMEDVNKIAFKALQERMNLELSKALIRVAMKKVAEYELKKEDRTLGSVLGVINALTEKADTRNWQTLPHSIYYCRVPLKEGQTSLTLKLTTRQGKTVDHPFTYQVKKGETLFHTFSSLESGYPSYGSN